jgi:glycosyltransferase involved in cell wall biosynthesis
MTLVESQENGVVPVVLDTFSSLQDIITNEKNGIIIERHNLNEFVKSLKKLMLDNSLREKMAINGLKSCSKFDIKNICDKWDLIFNQLKVK